MSWLFAGDGLDVADMQQMWMDVERDFIGFYAGALFAHENHGGASMSIRLEVKKQMTVPEGRHTATISKLNEAYRGAGNFHYIDVYFKLDEGGLEIKYGCPASISDTSKLGRLLVTAGLNLEVGTMVDLEQALIGKRFALMTMNKKGDKSDFEFAEIVEGSVKSLAPSGVEKVTLYEGTGHWPKWGEHAGLKTVWRD